LKQIVVFVFFIKKLYFCGKYRYNKTANQIPLSQKALSQLQRYCAYQDRCHSECRTKLIELGVYGDALEEILGELISEGFLDEERFAKSYARGKFRIKQWGRIRIMSELRFRKISPYCIKAAMTELDETDYLNTITELLAKYGRTHPDLAGFDLRQKATQYVLSKGFEPDLVFPLAKTFFETLSKQD
jgi:regulatory protein